MSTTSKSDNRTTDLYVYSTKASHTRLRKGVAKAATCTATLMWCVLIWSGFFSFFRFPSSSSIGTVAGATGFGLGFGFARTFFASYGMARNGKRRSEEHTSELQ